MTERFEKPLTFFEAIKEIAKFYVHVFKHIVGIVILAGLVQAFVSLLMPQNPTVGLAVSVLASVVSMFFYAWILYRADSVLMNRPETTKDALQVAKKRFLPLLGVLVVFILIIALFFLFGFGMQLLGNLLHLLIVFAIITVCIGLFIFTLLAFTGPAVVLDQMPVFKSFEFSAKLVWNHWWHTFGVFFIYAIPILLLSFALMLITNNILVLTILEYIYHIITYPLVISIILILYHDLKARHQKEGFKRVAEPEQIEKREHPEK